MTLLKAVTCACYVPYLSLYSLLSARRRGGMTRRARYVLFDDSQFSAGVGPAWAALRGGGSLGCARRDQRRATRCALRRGVRSLLFGGDVATHTDASEPSTCW